MAYAGLVTTLVRFADDLAAASSTYTLRIPKPLLQAFDEVASLHERNGSGFGGPMRPLMCGEG